MAAQAMEQFEAGLEKESGLEGVVHCTDYNAKTPEDRHDLGLPEQSPIWRLPGNELDRTAKYVPGLHHLFGYKSDARCGAPFALHKKDYDLVSLNVLYYRCKVGTIVAPRHASLVKQEHKSIWKHRHTCAQSLRHCSTWVLPRTLAEWGASAVTLRQYPLEEVVVLSRAYHQGFCLGSTLGEAVNYAPAGWSIAGYAGCSASCPGHPILNKHMAFRHTDEVQQGSDETDSEPDEDVHSDNKDNWDSRESSDNEDTPMVSTSGTLKPVAGAESCRRTSAMKRERLLGSSARGNTKKTKLELRPPVSDTVGTTKAEPTASHKHGRASSGGFRWSLTSS